MISVKEIIIVEGTYDKIRLSSFIDGIVFVTGGFSLMKDNDKIKRLSKLIETNGAVILTDSDSAGIRIRNYLKQHLPENKIKHAYIPEIAGKEKRKQKPGAERLLGVEGMTEEVIFKALTNAGCTINNATAAINNNEITKTFMYELGLTGSENSTRLRKILTERLGIPSKISTNMLAKYLSGITTQEDLKKLIKEIKNSSQL